MDIGNQDLYVTMDDYAMQDDERDLDFSPGQKRSRKTIKKSLQSSTSGALSSSLPSNVMQAPKDVKVVKVRLEKSRQSARECRARKKLRYQYLEELVSHREKAVLALREELSKQYLDLYHEVEKGNYPPEMAVLLGDQQQSSSNIQ